MTAWHLYMVRTRTGALYTGIATDVARRLSEHEGDAGRGAKYLRSSGPLQLVYTARVGDRSTALSVERRIKALSKSQKEALVAQAPPAGELVRKFSLEAAAGRRQPSRAPVSVGPISAEDRPWVASLIQERWSAPFVVVHGATYHPADLPGFKATRAGRPAGRITLHLEGGDCEVVTLDSLAEGRGVGSALVEAAASLARSAGCGRLWLVTTNDNLEAVGFYQRRGFRMVAVHSGAVDLARQKKPQIPLVGARGIPMRDEIEMELEL